MIYDTLDRADLYHHVHPRLKAAFDYLRSGKADGLEPGKHDIDGENMFVMVNVYDTKPVAESVYEAHRKYIDVQYIVSGHEYIGYAPLEDLTITKPYDADGDYCLLKGDGSMVHVRPGMFAVLFPNDAHMPNASTEATPTKVRKLVVKVKLA